MDLAAGVKNGVITELEARANASVRRLEKSLEYKAVEVAALDNRRLYAIPSPRPETGTMVLAGFDVGGRI
jgi:hypothetical protein